MSHGKHESVIALACNTNLKPVRSASVVRNWKKRSYWLRYVTGMNYNRPPKIMLNCRPVDEDDLEDFEENTGMRRITTFRSTKDHIYDGGPIIL